MHQAEYLLHRHIKLHQSTGCCPDAVGWAWERATYNIQSFLWKPSRTTGTSKMFVRRAVCMSIQNLTSYRMASGNCAFVTRNEEISRPCSNSTNSLMRGYIIGSPTSDRAQCRGCRPSSKRSVLTPGTPAANN